MKLSDKAKSTTHRSLIFGAPKSGKTKLIGSLASQFNLLWFDLENGYSTLLQLPENQQANIELISIPDTRTYPIAIESLLKIFTGQKCTICEAHGKVNCPICKRDSLPSVEIELNSLPSSTIVVVDSLTQLANSAMANITKSQDDEYKYEWDDYRKQGTLMDKFLTSCQQARFNLVCATHEAEVEMEDGRKKLVPVAGTTNFSRNTAKYFDHVIYCELKNKKHCFGSSTTYGNNIMTGSRTEFAIENETESSLLAIYTGERKVSNPVIPSNQAALAKLNQLKGKIQ